MQQGTLYRLAAFTREPAGGNPAGVWVGDTLPEDEQMLRIASEVGYSETAFVAPITGHEREIRYFSPEAEVTFCGHATIASGVVLGRAGGEGVYRLQTTVGEVPVTVRTQDGRLETALESVATRHEAVPDALLHEALAALDWQAGELATEIPPVRAYAGAWHLVLAAATRARLASLDYDFERLKALMLAENLTTLQLIWRESKTVFHARNPFPVGGVVEDPATGAAAAALGGYLRDAGLVKAPHNFVIRQGEDMGRPGLLHVEVPENGGIVVSGTAVDL
ncbi:MAG: PhzF family phenazine biosynthesis protein [Woeseia sp.]